MMQHQHRRKRGQRIPLDPELRMPCEVYSRIVGYLRPVQNYNLGKKQEFKDRRTYDISAV